MSEETNGDAMQSGDRLAPAVARMRLARRVSDVLMLQEDDVLVEAIASGEIMAGGEEVLPIQGDFSVSVLDLRVRLLLLVDRSDEALSDESELRRANTLLWSNTDTMACVLVCDDEALTARVVEYGDGWPGPRSEAPGRQPIVGPLRATLAEYLTLVRPNWRIPDSVLGGENLAYDDAARDAAEHAVHDRRSTAGRVAERQEARQALGASDAGWAMRLALEVAEGRSVDVDEVLTSGRSVGGER